MATSFDPARFRALPSPVNFMVPIGTVVPMSIQGAFEVSVDRMSGAQTGNRRTYCLPRRRRTWVAAARGFRSATPATGRRSPSPGRNILRIIVGGGLRRPVHEGAPLRAGVGSLGVE